MKDSLLYPEGTNNNVTNEKLVHKFDETFEVNSRRPRPWKGAKETGYVWFNDLRISHFLYAIPTLAIVATVGFLLIQLPVLSWGWWQALGGHGSIIFLSYGKRDSWMSDVFPLTMVIAVSFWVFRLASDEELQFRRDSQHYTRRGILLFAFIFGLAHMIMGIPLGLALALSLGGLVFSWHYLRAYNRKLDRTFMHEEQAHQYKEMQALKSSTLHHAAYNILALSAAAVAFIVDILFKVGVL